MSYWPAFTMSKTPSGALCLLAESMRIFRRPLDIFSAMAAIFLLASPKIGKLAPQVSARRRVYVSWAEAGPAESAVASVTARAARAERIFMVQRSFFVIVVNDSMEYVRCTLEFRNNLFGSMDSIKAS